MQLLYVHPSGGFAEVWVDGSGSASLGENEGLPTEPLRRLTLALDRRLREPALRGWLANVRRGLPQLRPTTDGDRVLHARTDPVGALRGFDATAPLSRPSAGALALRALLLAMAGLPLEAVPLAERAAEEVRGGVERDAIGRLLLALGRHASAAKVLDQGTREGRVNLPRLAHCAAEAALPEVAVNAASRLLRGTSRASAQAAGARSLLAAGAFEPARVLLEEATSAREDPALLACLADLHLWGLELEAAEDVAQRAKRAGAGASATLVLGAVRHLQGDLETALEWLAPLAAQEGMDETQVTARLWRMRALVASERPRDAIAQARTAGFDERLSWKLLRADAECSYGKRSTLYGKEAYQLRLLLTDLFDAAEVERAYETFEAGHALVRRAIDRLGGNLSSVATLLDGTRLSRLRLRSPRQRAVATQRELAQRSFDEVLNLFEAQRTRAPTSPFPRTYAAELLLWSGDYDGAVAAFESVWRETFTRWGYVGFGAALALQGHGERALAVWEEGKTHYDYLPAEATYAYRGDVHLDAGRQELALRDLTHATEATPSRVGAWASLALVHARDGAREAAAHALARVGEHAAGLLANALDRTHVEALEQANAPALARVAETVRASLAGNRASKIFTFCDEHGRRRVLVAVPGSFWSDLAGELEPLVWDEAEAERAVVHPD